MHKVGIIALKLIFVDPRRFAEGDRKEQNGDRTCKKQDIGNSFHWFQSPCDPQLMIQCIEPSKGGNAFLNELN